MAGRIQLIAAAMCATLCGGPAAAQSLIAQPSATDVALAYPDAALADGGSGAATVECVIAISGGLDSCEIISETPPDRGFGTAALSVIRHFRYAPTLPNGERSVGVRKRLTVRFSPASASEPASRDPQP